MNFHHGNRLLIFTLSLLFLISCTICSDPDEPQSVTHANIELTSISPNTASFRVQTDQFTGVWSYEIFRNDSLILTGDCFHSEFTFIDSNLFPATDYVYSVLNPYIDSGLLCSLEVTTLEQTVHDFQWVIDHFGIPGSYLNSVAMLDSNEFWAAGYIISEDPDSSFNGTGFKISNVIHWDGDSFRYMLVDRVTEMESVFAFERDDVWFSDGCYVYHYDGENFSKQWECNWEATGSNPAKRIWGRSNDDIYFVGNNGTIIHFNGNTFNLIESGTSVALSDVWGAGDEDVWIVGESTGFQESVVLRLSGGNCETVYYNNWTVSQDCKTLCRNFRSVWAIQQRVYLAGSSGIWSSQNGTDSWTLYPDTDINQEGIFERSIRGLNENDMFLIGNHGVIAHYDGYTWQQLLPKTHGLVFSSISLNKDCICIVGQSSDSRAFIIRSSL